MHAYDLIRWVVAVSLGLLGSWIVTLNFVIVYRWLVRREHHSWVPLVGGFLAFLGMLVCPLPRVQKFAWTPLLIDCGYVMANLTLGCGLILTRFIWGKKNTESDL